MNTATIHRHYPPGLVAAIVVSALVGRRRSLLKDLAGLAAILGPSLQITSAEVFEQRFGSILVVFNHYSRPGTPVWRTLFALGGALVLAGLTQPEPRWVMTAAWKHWGLFAPISRWMLGRIARMYGSFLMPPMPPAPEDAAACAATVRQVISFVRSRPDACVCLAPEGRDSGDGHLVMPLPGTGRFILQLCRAGLIILPAGVCEDGGVWHVRLGPTFTLIAPDRLLPDERDEWASRRVMSAIAELLPQRLRGAWQ